MIGKLKEHIRAMETINRIGISLSSESEGHKLLQLILKGAKRIINADGGAIYKVTDGNKIDLSMLQIDSIPLEMGLGKGPPAALEGLNEEAKRRTTEARAAVTQETVNVPDIYSYVSHDVSGNHAFDRVVGNRSRSVLAVPMKNHENEVTGVIQLLNARDKRTGEVTSFTMENQRLLESLASQAGVALSKNEMVQVYKSLFESLVELIAKAIDEKSPYTGDHCRRVPILVEMLTEAACRTREGNLKSFNLTEDELYELKVATLLHDCGKVTTPVHIIDKATKLEKIFDRIHLIDTRFEVLKRDAEISFIRRKVSSLESGEAFDNQAEEKKLRDYLDGIGRDRETLHAANVGAERMDESLRDQVKAMTGKYRWVNPGGQEEPLVSEEEIYHLLIPKGTLSPEDREIINYHMVATIKMLESLSYPKQLRNIPKYAGTHHERQDGSGYPRGLKGEEIPIQGRIMAIADVFEALTAKDRPYKKPLTLSESLRILKSMRDQGKLDPDLVDVFIGEKVFLRYAEQYLDPEQVDEEFLSEFRGYYPSN
jgi:HD-GYP domain-containing protein (c-di-GMP phosphodiesterase class II)